MTFRLAAPVALATLLAAAVAPLASARQTSGSSAGETGDQAYVIATEQNDLFAITEGRMAARRAPSAAVRAFGAKSAESHAASTRAVQAAARASGVVAPPPALSAQQRQLVRQLNSTPAASFSRIYLEHARDRNTESLALQQAFSKGDGDGGLRRVAGDLAQQASRRTTELQALEP